MTVKQDILWLKKEEDAIIKGGNIFEGNTEYSISGHHLADRQANRQNYHIEKLLINS